MRMYSELVATLVTNLFHQNRASRLYYGSVSVRGISHIDLVLPLYHQGDI